MFGREDGQIVSTVELRASGVEDFLVEALERTQEELSETAKLLTQRTFFAVPTRSSPSNVRPRAALGRGDRANLADFVARWREYSGSERGAAESNRRLLELNRSIAAGEVEYEPFRDATPVPSCKT